MSESVGFNRLHKGVQRWIWEKNWDSLRDIQEQAIEPILNANCDVVISASTAAGKTEAAFLPACSLVAEQSTNSIGILYISPLKALINDQHRRLQHLCELLDIPVTPWHGDVLRSVKDKQRKTPRGILLITPESLESLILNQAPWCAKAFKGLNHIIIDEFHAFIGTERGCQLQSLMRRLEFLLQRTIPRIALSATLGEMQAVAHYLRPDQKFPCTIIESKTNRSDLKVQLRGYVNPADNKDGSLSAYDRISNDLYTILRGKSHLVFANSRELTEQLSADLTDRCVRDGVPNEFFPHHGSLSKEIRESLEARLQEEKFPTTAVCTMTLELGIDIGAVDSIAQVTAPHSVASLRQRLGRSGRRGDAAVLRLFIPEEEITAKSHLLDKLRMETFQCIAMINLLLGKWYEPAPPNRYHFSTLVQQTLSAIAQYGGVRASQLWALLCESGSFALVDRTLYAAFLRALGERELITQMQDGQIVLGHKGEKLIEHYTFYSAFNTPEEYRLEHEGHVLGTIPISEPLSPEQLVIFAGKRWEVLSVYMEKKLITLKRAVGGKPPHFNSFGQSIHDIVRQEMFRVYQQKATPVYLNSEAKLLFNEGLNCFHSLGLGKTMFLQSGRTIYLLPWLGDKFTHTVTKLLCKEGLSAYCFGGVIDVGNTNLDSLRQAVDSIIQKPRPTATELAESVLNTDFEKYDYLLPNDLRNLEYGARFFDVDHAWQWLSLLAAKL